MTPWRVIRRRDRVSAGAATPRSVSNSACFSRESGGGTLVATPLIDSVNQGGHMIWVAIVVLGVLTFGYLKVRRQRKAAAATQY